MKVFSKAMLTAALIATCTNYVDAKPGKMFETNAYLTPKRESTNSEPYLKQNLVNLRQTLDEDSIETDNSMLHEIVHHLPLGGLLDESTHIITTSDISNYFNLQITTQLFFGSQQEPHDLILDTGSMVSTFSCLLFDKRVKETMVHDLVMKL